MAVVGPSVRHAVYRAIYTQLNAQVQAQAMQLGVDKVVYLNPMEAASVDNVNEGILMAQDSRLWVLWEAQARKNSAQLLENLK
jgi:HCOMODA/2-hydroxy-3-carboxy-muconic semialdehyde decarboxylase